jgi:DNA primase catalytic subunit
MDSDDLSQSEFYARKQMIELCWDIYSEYCNNIDDEFEEDEE